MAGRPRLGLLAAGVVALHLAALDWFARELEYGSVLQPAADPMFTRLLLPAAPPAPVAAPPVPSPALTAPNEGVMAAKLPRPTAVETLPATSTATAAEESPTPADPEVAATDADAPLPPEAATQSDAQAPPAAPAPAEPVIAADPAPPPATAMDSWPGDTRLTYRLGGQFRSGELYGDARVQWQRDGGNYQVRLDIDITPFVTMVMTSQGEVTEQGLAPRAYEEARRGKRRAAQFGERAIALEGGRSAPRPAGVQDTASQFVELAHRFATGRETLEVGKAVTFWMARPGAVDQWTYDIVGRVILQTPQLGAVEAFHLKPRPIANPRGNVYAEMWFAPSLRYLPVRIKVSMGDEAYVDLMVDKIEQR